MRNKTLGIAVLAFCFAFGLGNVQADVPEAVQKSFDGRILITDQPLPKRGGSESRIISSFERAHIAELSGTESDEGIAAWEFYFTAFLKRAPKNSALSLDFYTDDADRLFVAQKRFLGVDPVLRIVASHVNIDENDGLLRGRSYLVKLTTTRKGRDITLAQTKLTTK